MLTSWYLIGNNTNLLPVSFNRGSSASQVMSKLPTNRSRPLGPVVVASTCEALLCSFLIETVEAEGESRNLGAEGFESEIESSEEATALLGVSTADILRMSKVGGVKGGVSECRRLRSVGVLFVCGVIRGEERRGCARDG